MIRISRCESGISSVIRPLAETREEYSANLPLEALLYLSFSETCGMRNVRVMHPQEEVLKLTSVARGTFSTPH